MKPMTVEQILNDQTGAGEKTAAAAQPVNIQDRLVSTVQGVMDTFAGGGEKTAAAAAPTPAPSDPPVAAELLKMAADLAGADNAALVKEGQLMGAAIMDGAMLRMAEWNQAAEAMGTPEGEKTAADRDFEKFAAAYPTQVKTAASEGYNAVVQGVRLLQKQASDGTQLLKVAHAAYVRGYKDMSRVANAAARR